MGPRLDAELVQDLPAACAWHAHATVWGMTVALQIKDVREEVRDAIAARAAALGQSMQTYLREILEREFRAERNKHLFDNLVTHRSLSLDVDDVVSHIRAGRESDHRDDS